MIKEIRADVKISFKQMTKSGDVFYTFSYGETRQNEYTDEATYNADVARLWQICNDQVGNQIRETKTLYQQN